MKRKLYSKLLQWKNTSNGKSAVMIDGARRVGKSYIAEEFAKNEYESYLIIDFAKASRKVKSFFEDYLEDLDTFFMYLCASYHVHLPKGKSVIIFDEVQRFPRAREAIKYLVQDGRYHYIETGSLISIKKNVKDIVIPSEEYHIKMFPMDFEEFLWATDNSAMIPIIEKAYTERKPVGAAMHKQIMDVFRQYVVVGGMPQVVAEFAATKDLAKVDMQKRTIIELYKGDIRKFAGSQKEKIASIFTEIPSQLSKHEKKFSLSVLNGEAKMRDYDGAFEWLKSAMTVNICYNSTDPNIGLRLNMDRTTLKCYMGDTGLLVSLAFDENELAGQDIHIRLLTGDIELNEGMLMENVVAQMFRAQGHKLYFYSRSDRNTPDERMEIDFLLAKSKVDHANNIIPIEVKSGRKYATKSLEKYIRKFPQYTSEAIILHTKDLDMANGFARFPIYMAPLLLKRNG